MEWLLWETRQFHIMALHIEVRQVDTCVVIEVVALFCGMSSYPQNLSFPFSDLCFDCDALGPAQFMNRWLANVSLKLYLIESVDLLYICDNLFNTCSQHNVTDKILISLLPGLQVQILKVSAKIHCLLRGCYITTSTENITGFHVSYNKS